jgi:hypothetical protein
MDKVKFFLPYLLIAGLLVTASMTMKHKFLHFSEHAPWGIVSLELTGNNKEQQLIFREWDRPGNFVFERDYGADVIKGVEICGVEVARKQLHADFLFIVFYVASIILLFSRYVSGGKLFMETNDKLRGDTNGKVDDQRAKPVGFLSKRQFFWLSLLVGIAGVFDVLENVFLLRSIDLFNRGLSGEAFAASLFAHSKFLLLLFSLVFFCYQANIFKRLSNWLISLSSGFVNLLRLSWTFRIVLILQLVLFALLNFSDQGQDLLVTINNSTLGTIIFLTSITVMAALNWYLPKLYIKQPKKLNLVVAKGTSFSRHENVPLDYARLLGTVTFFIPAVGMLKTMQQYHIPYFLDDIPALILLAIGIWLTVLVIRRNLIAKYFVGPKGVFYRRYWLTMALIMLLALSFYFLQLLLHFGKLSFLCTDLFLFGLGFLLTVSLRTELETKYNFNMARVVILFGLTAAILFLLFNLDPILLPLTAWDRFFTLSVVLWALAGYALLFSFLLALSNKWKIQLITILLVGCAAGSAYWISDFHNVEVVEAKDAKRDSLTVYVRNWLDSNRNEIDEFAKTDSTGYPVFFVNSYGGGIRAAAWATMVIGSLDKKMQEISGNKINGDFQHHVFSYSGASGGTVGFSLLCAFRIAKKLPDSSLYPSRDSQVFKKDYLTGNIVGIFGRDVPMSVLGLKLYDDRARLQERILAYSLKKKYQVDYDIPLADLYPIGKVNIPLLFSNTYDINTGMKGIVAPVLLRETDFPSVVCIQDLMKDQDIPLSAAAFLSARFPFVSPTGKFNQQHHFTDGGTLENSGAQTSLQVIEVFERVAKEEKYRSLKLSINILSLSNEVPAIDTPKPEKNLYEIAAPILGILNTIHGNAVRADRVNKVIAAQRGWKYNKLSPSEHKINNSWPVLPLGWQISDDALSEMVTSIESQKDTLNKILGKLILQKAAPKLEKRLAINRHLK